ncbi:hypothetical protein LINPERHAP1_LOCUS8488 [Linum perenne]
MKQKSKKLVSPYTAIKYGKRGKAVKVIRDPLPPFINITPFERKMINYARDKKMPEGERLRTRTSIDISLLRLDMVTLNYNEQVSTNVIDEYTHILNLQQMIVFKGRPKRWVCSLSMAGCVHAGINKEEIPIDQLFNGLLDTLDVKEALMETEFLFFPIYNGSHYSLFVVNRRDKRFEFLDSKYPNTLDTKWRATADRVMKYAIAYYKTYCGPDHPADYEWYSIEDVLQRRGTNECGIYLLNLVEAWEGQVEDYMVNKWKLEEYCNNRRDSICLKLLTYINNKLIDDLKIRVAEWNSP